MGDSQNTADLGDGLESNLTDPAVFAAEYRQAYPRLWLIAAGMVGDRAYADDLVQDAVIVAWQKRAQFRPHTNCDAWFAEIVRRCALNYRHKVRGRKTVTADPSVIDATHVGPTPWERPSPVEVETGVLTDDKGDFGDEVLAALASVGSDARCCLLLRIVHHLSYEEIAELLQMPAGTAMSHVHRAKKMLRIRLQQGSRASRVGT